MAASTGRSPRVPRIGVPGVAANSPLANMIARALSGTGEIVPLRRQGTIGWLWLKRLAGSSLDPTVRIAGAEPNGSPELDIVLDLFGDLTNSKCRTWRIVNGFGNGVMEPFRCLANAPETRAVTSLFLIEGAGEVADMPILAEAHISARRGRFDLLNAIARTVAWLIRKAVDLEASKGDGLARTLTAVPRLSLIKDVLATRVASVVGRLRDHLCSEIWAIGLIGEPVEAFLTSRSVEPPVWIDIPMREGFVADPFPWPGRPGSILYERYSHRTGIGSLEARIVGELDGPRTEPVELNVVRHLSYPFTFAQERLTVCLPEMTAERRQVMYVLSPNQPATPLCVVAEDVAMADPTLFRHAGYYWIAYNDADLGLHENLSLLFATRLEGPWTSHPSNPVKIDVRSSRPAGAPFEVGGSLLRPAQDCSESYGCAVVINRIVTCTPREYHEEYLSRLTPAPEGHYSCGLHTFSVTPEGTILIDGKRTVFSLAIGWQRLLRRLRRLISSPAS